MMATSDNTAGRHDDDPSSSSVVSPPCREMFLEYQAELDCRHDRYERILKHSRDITIESKRVIFQLHRIDGTVDREAELLECQHKLVLLQKTKWRLVAVELQNEDHFQFIRAYSPGLQEYIEALSFYYYLQHFSLISYNEVVTTLQFSSMSDNVNAERTTDRVTAVSDSSTNTRIPPPPPPISSASLYVNVPPIEYLMGVADLTGELMRLAIRGVGGHGDVADTFKLCQFLRDIERGLSSFWSSSSRGDMQRKMTVLRQSVRKVEAACYALKVRGSEQPRHIISESLLLGASCDEK